MSKVVERVFLGDNDDARSVETLQRLNITHAVNCTNTVPNYFDVGDGGTGNYSHDPRLLRVQYFRVPIADVEEGCCCGGADDGKLLQHLMRAASTFISSALAESPTNNVLVYSCTGRSRAATIMLAHLMLLSAAEASSSTALLSKRTAASGGGGNDDDDDDGARGGVGDAAVVGACVDLPRLLRQMPPRPRATPNLGFWKHLVALEAKLNQAPDAPRAPECGWPRRYLVDS